MLAADQHARLKQLDALSRLSRNGHLDGGPADGRILVSESAKSAERTANGLALRSCLLTRRLVSW